MRGKGGVVGSQPMSIAVHIHVAWSPNKLWRSTSIFNLLFQTTVHSLSYSIGTKSLFPNIPKIQAVRYTVFWDPWIRDPDQRWKKSGFGMNKRYEQPGSYSESLVTIFRVKNT
jgi:hypothetical protein